MRTPNATVGGGELSGIGMLSSNLMHSQETDYFANNPDMNSYLNNSSVAKTAVHKRRNISIGVGAVNPVDRGGLDTATAMRPTHINNTYDGSNISTQRPTQMKVLAPRVSDTNQSYYQFDGRRMESASRAM